jgi:hypothetical protein
MTPEEMMTGDGAEMPAKAPQKAPDAPKGGKVYITPPEGLDLSELEDGKEGDMVCKLKMDGDRLCLVAINGIPISQSTEEPEEEIEEEESPESESAGDRFMSKFRPQPRSVS